MNKKLMRALGIMLVMAMVLVPVPEKAQAAGKGVTVTKFADMLEKVLGGEVVITDENVPESEELISRAQAMYLLNKADEIKNGPEYDQKLYDAVIKNNRITDLGEIDENLQDGVVKAYIKGYMRGYSDGMYTRTRSIHGNENVKKKGAKSLKKLLKKGKGLAEFTEDGQMLRTTNLPSNHSRYSYILADFPNAFYERKTQYDLNWTSNGKPVEFVEYVDFVHPRNLTKTQTYWSASSDPSFPRVYVKDVIEKKKDKWCDIVEKNMQLRLSFNYKTVDENWKKELLSTYRLESFSRLDEYIANGKKNKLQITYSDIVVEPSAMYEYDNSYYIRCYARYKVTSSNFDSTYDGNLNLIFSKGGLHHSFKNLQNNVWHEGYYDIPICSGITYERGDTMKIWSDYLVDY